MKTKDLTVPKEVFVKDVGFGKPFRTINCRENALYVRVNPSNLSNLNNVGDGRLAMKIDDGSLHILTDQIKCYELEATLVIDRVVS